MDKFEEMNENSSSNAGGFLAEPTITGSVRSL